MLAAHKIPIQISWFQLSFELLDLLFALRRLHRPPPKGAFHASFPRTCLINLFLQMIILEKELLGTPLSGKASLEPIRNLPYNVKGHAVLGPLMIYVIVA